MSDLKRAVRDAADRHRPPPDWLDRIHERARRKRQNQRLLAGALAFALFFTVAMLLIRQLATEGRTVPAGRPSAAPAPTCGTGTHVRPTGWWTGDGTPADAAGGHDAILHGDASFALGLIGDAFTFDGHGDWAEVPDDPALNVGSGDFTIALWVRFHAKGGEQVFAEDWVQRGRGDSVGWTFTKVGGGGILFTLGPSGGVGTGRLDLPLDTWTHVAAVRRAGTLSILVNGEVMATEAMSDTEVPVDSPASLKFGHRGGSRDTPGAQLDQGFFLDGELDDILFFVGRGLSDAQIRRIFVTQSACGM